MNTPHHDVTSITLGGNAWKGTETLGYDNIALSAGVPSINFNSWISDPGFGLDPAEQDFALDPDFDGLANGLEAWFGTHPGQSSPGLAVGSNVGLATTFTHPQNATPPVDLTGFYEWSPNLTDWFTSGNGPDGGATVTFSANTSGTTTTVTATVSEAVERIFFRAVVTLN